MFSRFHHRRGPSTSSTTTPTSPIPPGPDSWPVPDAQTTTALPRTHRRTFSGSSTGTAATTATMAMTATETTTGATAGTGAAAAAAAAASAKAAATTASSPLPSLPPVAQAASVLTASSSDNSVDIPGDTATSPPGPAGLADPSAQATTSAPTSTHATSPHHGLESPQPGTSHAFIGGMALENLRRQGPPHDLSTAAAAAAARMAAPSALGVDTAGPAAKSAQPPTYGTSERRLSRTKAPPPPINTNLASRPQHRAPLPQPAAVSAPATALAGLGKRDVRSPTATAHPSFVTPTDLQSSAAAAAIAATAANASAAPNGSAAGTTNASSSAAAAAANASAGAGARTKKSSLPFLKNPVSSLLSRRSKMGSPDLDAGVSDAPVYVPIRGTRVHDFSASRSTRRAVPHKLPVPVGTAAAAAVAALSAAASPDNTAAAGAHDRNTTATPIVNTIPPSPIPSLPHGENVSTRVSSALGTTAKQGQQQQQMSSPSSRTSSATPDAAHSRNPSIDPRISVQSLQMVMESRPLSATDKPLPERPLPEQDDEQQPVLGESNNSSGDSAVPAAAAAAGPVGIPLSERTASTQSRAASTDAAASLLRSTTASTGTSRSDGSPGQKAKPEVSDDEKPNTASAPALPRHMKSTSSRFSFMLGSAGQEQLLEERHRQKQLEKKEAAAAAASRSGPHDSRFDDFDDDSFDYDAMMDDDGLEERIPGVNADADDDDDGAYEEDVPEAGLDDDYEAEMAAAPLADSVLPPLVDATDTADAEPSGGVLLVPEDDDPDGLDPNNDQENFAGFVFQRFDPASSLVTPSTAGMVATTPRDAGGRVIGFAVTQNTPPLPEVDGPPPPPRDDLYFDQGLVDELDFAADDGGPGSAPFDESIFDSNDTDIYGRPIPGAFARAQAERIETQRAMAAAIDAAVHMDTPQDPGATEVTDTAEAAEATSTALGGLGGRPALLASHFASPHMGSSTRPARPQDPATDQEGDAKDGVMQRNLLVALRRQLPPLLTDAERVAAYQAALAEAAYKAAASGKFRRDSMSPPVSPGPPSSPPAALSPGDGVFGLSPIPDRNSNMSMSMNRGLGLGLGLGIEEGDHGLEASPTKNTTAAVDATSADHVPDMTTGPHTHLAYAFTSHSDLDYHMDGDAVDDDDGNNYINDYDDDFDLDDETVAQANLEVLANDSDGFYGREFNFYSSAPAAQQHHHHHHASDAKAAETASSDDGEPAAGAPSYPTEIEYANGGYFIPAGVGRSTSGRVVSREPNLTPITERSEYSNRNSVLSMGLPPLGSYGSFGSGGGSGSGELRSPGLAQLALLADDGDMSDMTLSALLRLRSRAFGGTGGGGGSQGSSRAGSPMLAPSTLAFAMEQQQQQQEDAERGSDEDDGGGGGGSGSPTLTNLGMGFSAVVPVQQPPPDHSSMSRATSASMSESGLWMRGPGDKAAGEPSSPLPTASPIYGPGLVASPTTRTPSSPTSPSSRGSSPPPPPIPAMSVARRTGGRRKGHRHMGSADSISYVKEEEAGGETRWVMERRRTGETGEVELLEREVVGGI